ncbi:hypothetical protein SIO17_13845 [Pseudoalteromonas piscicida]|uniref:hypothetical protein n=1 Tax=Pseudoalteromonas piscicida TaxID=43662 RepID=UPI0012DDBFA2|nr:hypothetical protein [Pseudoalteromonas piscicida]WPU30192.1 hypothetical protein SIO17_13845 [Pseudoalteromonas piscicida]
MKSLIATAFVTLALTFAHSALAMSCRVMTVDHGSINFSCSGGGQIQCVLNPPMNID